MKKQIYLVVLYQYSDEDEEVSNRCLNCCWHSWKLGICVSLTKGFDNPCVNDEPIRRQHERNFNKAILLHRGLGGTF